MYVTRGHRLKLYYYMMAGQPPDIDAYLSQRYYNVKSPGGFSSVDKLYRSIQREGLYSISRKRIEQWAQGEEALTLNRDARNRRSSRRKVVTGLNNCLWDGDLLILNQKRFTDANDGIGYILVCLDVLSRVCHVAMLKTKKKGDVLEGFKDIFSRGGGVRPRNLRLDRGSEFRNKLVMDYMKRMGIHQYFANSSTKANFSESMIKTLKKRLFRIFQHRGSYKYTDILQDVVANYNGTYHSSLKMAPNEVTEANQETVWFNRYFPPAAYKKAFKVALRGRGLRKRTKPKFRFQVGDTVLVSYLKKPFDRAYDENYSAETFTVVSRRLDQGLPIYFLKDYKGHDVHGAFYSWELQSVRFDPDAAFPIDEILATRTRKGVKESLVHFKSWPDSYNEWLPTHTIKDKKV